MSAEGRWYVRWLDAGAGGPAGPGMFCGDALKFEFQSLQSPATTQGHADYLNAIEAQLEQAKAALREIADEGDSPSDPKWKRDEEMLRRIARLALALLDAPHKEQA